MPTPRFSHHVGLELATNPFFEPFAGFGKNIFPGFRIFFSPQRQQNREKSRQIFKNLLKVGLLFFISGPGCFGLILSKRPGLFLFPQEMTPKDWRNSYVRSRHSQRQQYVGRWTSDQHNGFAAQAEFHWMKSYLLSCLVGFCLVP